MNLMIEKKKNIKFILCMKIKKLMYFVQKIYKNIKFWKNKISKEKKMLKI